MSRKHGGRDKFFASVDIDAPSKGSSRRRSGGRGRGRGRGRRGRGGKPRNAKQTHRLREDKKKAPEKQPRRTVMTPKQRMDDDLRFRPTLDDALRMSGVGVARDVEAELAELARKKKELSEERLKKRAEERQQRHQDDLDRLNHLLLASVSSYSASYTPELAYLVGAEQGDPPSRGAEKENVALQHAMFGLDLGALERALVPRGDGEDGEGEDDDAGAAGGVSLEDRLGIAHPELLKPEWRSVAGKSEESGSPTVDVVPEEEGEVAESGSEPRDVISKPMAEADDELKKLLGETTHAEHSDDSLLLASSGTASHSHPETPAAVIPSSRESDADLDALLGLGSSQDPVEKLPVAAAGGDDLDDLLGLSKVPSAAAGADAASDDLDSLLGLQ